MVFSAGTASRLLSLPINTLNRVWLSVPATSLNWLNPGKLFFSFCFIVSCIRLLLKTPGYYPANELDSRVRHGCDIFAILIEHLYAKKHINIINTRFYDMI